MPRACDEAFCDAFLSGSGVHQYAVFDRHVHKIRAIKPSKSEMLTGKESPTKRKKNKSTTSSSSSSSSINNKVTNKDALEAKMAADGWTKEEKKREGSNHVDKYWIDPAGGKKCRSVVEVARRAYPEFLNNTNGNDDDNNQVPKKRVKMELPIGWRCVIHEKTDGEGKVSKWRSYKGPNGENARSIPEIERKRIQKELKLKKEKEEKKNGATKNKKKEKTAGEKRKRVRLPLPKGFKQQFSERKTGKSIGQKDAYYIEIKTKRKFRSLVEVHRYLGNPLPKKETKEEKEKRKKIEAKKKADSKAVSINTKKRNGKHV